MLGQVPTSRQCLLWEAEKCGGLLCVQSAVNSGQFDLLRASACASSKCGESWCDDGLKCDCAINRARAFLGRTESSAHLQVITSSNGRPVLCTFHANAASCVRHLSCFPPHHFWGKTCLPFVAAAGSKFFLPWFVFAKGQVAIRAWTRCNVKSTAHCFFLYIFFSRGIFALYLNVLHQHRTAVVHDKRCFLACHLEACFPARCARCAKFFFFSLVLPPLYSVFFFFFFPLGATRRCLAPGLAVYTSPWMWCSPQSHGLSFWNPLGGCCPLLCTECCSFVCLFLVGRCVYVW